MNPNLIFRRLIASNLTYAEERMLTRDQDNMVAGYIAALNNQIRINKLFTFYKRKSFLLPGIERKMISVVKSYTMFFPNSCGVVNCIFDRSNVRSPDTFVSDDWSDHKLGQGFRKLTILISQRSKNKNKKIKCYETKRRR